MNKVEDDPTGLLKEVHNLARSISAGVEDVVATGRRICNEKSKYQFASDDSLHIGRESVQPLIDLKNITTDVFVDLETFSLDNSSFTEDTDLEPAFRRMEKDIKEGIDFVKKSDEFMRKLNFMTEVILYLECDDNSETNKPVPTLSAAASHPCREVPNVASKSDETNQPVSTLLAPASRSSREVHNVASKSDKTALRSYDDLTKTRQKKQDDRRKLLETFEVLMELRRTARARKEVEDEPTRLLKEAHNLAKSISAGVEDVITSGRRTCNETEDIKFQFPSDVDDSFHIGRESVQPLIELKNIATEVFADLDLETMSIDHINFTEDTDLEPACQEIKEDIKERHELIKKCNECMTKLNFITEVMQCLELDDENETNEPVSTLSEAASHPSRDVHNVASKSDTGKTELRTYDNLTATRWEKEDEISRLLLEAHDIASSMGISLEVIGTEKYGEEIDIKYEFLFEDSLNIGRKSMSPLIEFENIVAEMFAVIGKDEEEMKNFINRKDQFIKQLNSAEEIIASLQIGRETVRTEPTLSVTRNVEVSMITLCIPYLKIR